MYIILRHDFLISMKIDYVGVSFPKSDWNTLAFSFLEFPSFVNSRNLDVLYPYKRTDMILISSLAKSSFKRGFLRPGFLVQRSFTVLTSCKHRFLVSHMAVSTYQYSIYIGQHTNHFCSDTRLHDWTSENLLSLPREWSLGFSIIFMLF